MISLFIPSPHQGVWHLGPIPLRGYAVMILLGAVVCVLIAERRWQARGGRAGFIQDMTLWVAPFGLVGARLYSLMTDSDRYFDHGRVWWEPFAIWHGGIGIWGFIAGGSLGAWIGCRRAGVRLPVLADVLAPCLLVAQGIGRWGNWFNQELYGRATNLPWGLKIDESHWPVPHDAVASHITTVFGTAASQYATFQPTYLYECLWDLAAAALIFWLDRRFKFGHGRAFALYAMVYTVGRGWIEYLRIDSVQHHVLGLRLNDWTALLVFLAGLTYFVVVGRRHLPREESPYVSDSDADHTATPVTN